MDDRQLDSISHAIGGGRVALARWRHSEVLLHADGRLRPQTLPCRKSMDSPPGRPAISACIYIWDFIIERADQSACWLHPNFSNNAVAYGELGDQAARAPPLVAPPSGPGGSQGHGTYRWYKDAKTQQKLNFDKSKNIAL